MKSESIIQICIILFGLGFGAHFSKVAYLEHEKLGHSELQAHKEMDHGSIDVSNDNLIPEIVDLKVVKDPMSGWNIYLEVNNFHFAPQLASQAHRVGEGHAHLYINGNKIGRMYSNWYHIPEFLKDKNEVKVTLNSNDHQALTVGEKVIEKIKIVG